MKFSRTRLAQTVADHTLQTGASKQLSRQIAAYLLSMHGTNQLDSLLRDIQSDWARAGYLEVLAYSAHDLTNDVIKDIERLIKQQFPAAKQLKVTRIYDPEVIGSVRLKLADQQLDLSIEAKLNQFKQLTTGKD